MAESKWQLDHYFTGGKEVMHVSRAKGSSTTLEQKVLIERVQVEGGFLDGLDIQFQAGLNVLIGARGTGKTSLIELIRFVLGAQAFTQDAARRGYQQAISVLHGGQVTITLRDEEERFLVTRGMRDELPRSTRPIPSVMILAQSEIEAVGAQASGRLHLIDRFRPNRAEVDGRHSHLVSELRSLTAEIGGILDEHRAISDQIVEMKSIREARIAAHAEQQDLFRSIEATANDRQELARVQTHAATLAVRDDIYERAKVKFRGHGLGLRKIEEGLRKIEEWPTSAGTNDLLGKVRERGNEAAAVLSTAIESIRSAESEILELKTENNKDRIDTDERARVSRRELEKLQAGAGEVARRVEVLTEREAQLGALEELAKDRADKIEELQEMRRGVFERIEEGRAERFESRNEIANRLKETLGPKIRTEIIESGMIDEYTNVLVSALRGSGLRYNSLAPQIANNMSPLEIVEAVESSDVQAITEAVEINANRAASVIAYLQSRKLADLVSAPVDDAVELSLLDGVEFKKSDNLSIGQRCTVVLPFLLSGHRELLIIDQPEDHLDNAFITEALVERLRVRPKDAQFIMASHNANIPVLGEADLVVRLGSDGRRGFVEHAGQLDEPETATAITSLMEGGAEAFRRRAEFYSSVLGSKNG